MFKISESVHFPSTFRLHHPYFSVSIYIPAHINRLQDYCSPIDKFKIISKFVQFIPDSSSHSPKQVRLPQTPDIPFGSSPRPRRHTASPASRTRASAPAGSATPRRFPEHPRRTPRPMLPESASRPPGDRNKRWPSEMPLHTFSKYVSGISRLNTSLHVITVTRSSVSERLMIL